MDNVTYPKSPNSLVVDNIDKCRLACLRNCSCTAFAYDNQCLILGGDLVNVKQLSSDGMIGKVWYLRVAASKKDQIIDSGSRKRKTTWIVVGVLAGIVTLFSIVLDEKQFQAEVRTLGAIQHINLVHLRGFCADSTRLLVYDYVPNGSLQSVLVQNHPLILDWKARYHIAIGIARGLAYFHEDCRDCVIHYDIKPKNILLDEEYSPKVADFGLAKLIGRHHSLVLTTGRGTGGYLAPEWLTGEAITPKPDVFSYH
ncbi:putative protein kinase RLK-Pelle-SD-2b family [Rosa chinensis]|uniref:Protein kinase domain-containing protein n=1 Tax=Rosa chinensis TaxID=74649 RepID=A0A2P6RU70_ROSCH|nr:putative protein kinase RLK-Pelle-SD-2b family [Rosa chinensis]